MFDWRHIETVAKYWSVQMPLDVFVFIGSFLEEIIPPVPSILVMTVAGSLCHSQQHGLVYILWLALAGAAGKTLADFLFYTLGDKLENAVTKKFGWLIGVKHEDLENVGKRFTGGWKDGLIVWALRAFPFGPTVSLSVLCGIIRFHLPSFLIATFTGLVVRDLIYLYMGYAGFAIFAGFMKQWHAYDHLLSWLLFFIMLGAFVWLYRHTKAKQTDDSVPPSVQ